MKVAFFSESIMMGVPPRDFDNARTEIAWSVALGAPFLTFNASPTTHFDLVLQLYQKTIQVSLI